MSDVLVQTVPHDVVQDAPRALREHVVCLLKSMATLAGNQVEPSRALPIAIGSAPCISVYTQHETYSWAGDAPPLFDTICNLVVEGYVSGSPLAKIEAQTDLLKRQIIAMISQPAFWNFPLERIVNILAKTEFKGDADRFEGFAIVEFDIKYLEKFEPNLPSLSGTQLPGPFWFAPPGAGAPLQEIDLTLTSAAGETLTGATISISTTLSPSS